MLHKAVKLYETPILSWAFVPLRYVTPNNGNAFTPPPLIKLDAKMIASRNLLNIDAIPFSEYQLIRS
jgi:hypothetical protein